MENIISKEKLINDVVDGGTPNGNMVEAAIAGCRDSFLAVINEHKEYLYKTAFLYVKNENEASEIYQNTVFKAYLHINKLKKPEYFKTWITRILINTVNDTFRQSKKEMEVYSRQALENYKENMEIEDRIVLYDAIDALKPNYKTPLILRYIHDMSIKDISLVMNCSENTVKSYIHRAKNKLTRILGGKNYERL